SSQAAGLQDDAAIGPGQPKGVSPGAVLVDRSGAEHDDIVRPRVAKHVAGEPGERPAERPALEDHRSGVGWKQAVSASRDGELAPDVAGGARGQNEMDSVGAGGG